MRRNLRQLIAAAGALACPLLAHAQVATWNAAAGGNWNTAANWSPAVVPNGANFDVFFSQALSGPYTATLDIGVTARDLSVTHANATLDLTTNAITLNRNLTVNEGLIRATGGSLTVSGTTRIQGNGKVRSVALRTIGTLLLTSDDGPIDIDDTDIDHEGAATWTGANALQFNGGATLTIDATAGFTLGSAASATWNSVGTQPLITNHGSIIKSSGTGTSTFSGPSIDNRGTIRINLNSEIRFLAPATLLNLSGATLTGGTYNLFDTLRIPGASISTLKADVTLDGVAAEIVSSTGVDAFGALNLIDVGGSLNVRNSKTVSTTGGVTVNGTLIVDGGTFAAGGPISVGPTGFILGTGTVSSSTTAVAGAISAGFSPGRIIFDGNLLLRENARVKFEIGGPTPVQQHDVVRVLGAAGILASGNVRAELRAINGFIPPIGSFYDVMFYEARTGQFAQITGTRAGPDRSFVPQYLPDRLRLFVVFDECAGADFNGDGVIDFFDYLDFASAFDAQDPSADFNSDGQVDFFDYLDFVEVLDRCSG